MQDTRLERTVGFEFTLGGAISETSRVIKKDNKGKRVKKIRWPKNFDPRNPGATPDPERWVHKLERIKGKKKGDAKGSSARQGSSNVDLTTTKSTFQQGPSTANIGAVAASSKKSKRK